VDVVRIFSVTDDFDGLWQSANTHHEGRSSVSLHDGETSVLRQTMTALLAGQAMKVEHPPHEGWIFVVEGDLEMKTAESRPLSFDVPIGSLMQLPNTPLTLTAREDSLLLLTVAMGDRPHPMH
jgi:hypothetical protein